MSDLGERLASAYPRSAIIETWRINDSVTTFLLENLPDELWPETVPGAARRTVRMIAGHLHNCRCMWIKTCGAKHGLSVPRSVDRFRCRPANGGCLRTAETDRSGIQVGSGWEGGTED